MGEARVFVAVKNLNEVADLNPAAGSEAQAPRPSARRIVDSTGKSPQTFAMSATASALNHPMARSAVFCLHRKRIDWSGRTDRIAQDGVEGGQVRRRGRDAEVCPAHNKDKGEDRGPLLPLLHLWRVGRQCTFLLLP